MSESQSRIVRTLVQLLAGGAFTALFDQIATDVPQQYAPYVVIFTTLLVTIAQNEIEQATGKRLFAPAE